MIMESAYALRTLRVAHFINHRYNIIDIFSASHYNAYPPSPVVGSNDIAYLESMPHLIDTRQIAQMASASASFIRVSGTTKSQPPLGLV